MSDESLSNFPKPTVPASIINLIAGALRNIDVEQIAETVLTNEATTDEEIIEVIEALNSKNGRSLVLQALFHSPKFQKNIQAILIKLYNGLKNASFE